MAPSLTTPLRRSGLTGSRLLRNATSVSSRPSAIAATRFLSSGIAQKSLQKRPVLAPRLPVSSLSTSSHRYMASTAATSEKWVAPSEEDLYKRPVLIVGAGNLGSRLAVMWASAKRPVVVYDHSQAALDAARPLLSDRLARVCANEGRHPGHVAFSTDLNICCATAPWMVLEALPENLELKKAVLGKVEAFLYDDCIIATNSSSYRAEEMVGEGGVTKPSRFLNTHYYVPPRNTYVELMTSGKTDEAIFPFLARQMEVVGLKPLVLPLHVQSDGFIFNRIWGAAKRETLAVLADGIAKPADIDALFRDFFHAEKGPCEKMDEVGLDTVYKIEAHTLGQQPNLKSQPTLDWLKKEYLEKNQLGEKTGDGLLTAKERDTIDSRYIHDESKGA